MNKIYKAFHYLSITLTTDFQNDNNHNNYYFYCYVLLCSHAIITHNRFDGNRIYITNIELCTNIGKHIYKDLHFIYKNNLQHVFKN